MNPYLLIGLETSALLLKEEVASCSLQRYDVRPDPERFSFREVCAHLSDWEPIMLNRIRDAIERPGCELVAYDELKRANEQRYDLTDPIREINAFVVKRVATLEYLQTVLDSQWFHIAVHPERGELRSIDIANTLLAHDLNHLAQIRQMRSSE